MSLIKILEASKRLLYKLTLPLLLSLFISSCALHASFPFICFRKGCAKSNKAPGAKGGQKVKLKTILYTWKKKSKIGKKKKKYSKDKILVEKSGSEDANDTLIVEHGIIPHKEFFRLYFYIKPEYEFIAADSTLLENHNLKELTEDEIEKLKYYIHTIKRSNIKRVVIKVVTDIPGAEPMDYHMARRKSKKVRKVLVDFGIKEGIIIVLEK